MPIPLVNAYDLSMRTHEAAAFFYRLCDTLKPLPRTAYRGISRFPLQCLPSRDPQILRGFEDSGCDIQTDFCARLRFLELLGDDIPEDLDDDLLPDYSAALEVFSLLQSREDYEIVQVQRAPFPCDTNCLGFDIGYWGGDHYSIICDSAVRPCWHPPQPECFDELARALSLVNEHFLFSTIEDAEQFRAYYRTQYWAETEFNDEFCIIQLSLPTHNARS